MWKVVIKKLRDAASERAAGGCEIKDWRGAVVGLKKSCAEYRSGTKQECGVSKLNLPLTPHSTLALEPRASLSLRQ
jgi:hypothetical protein